MFHLEHIHNLSIIITPSNVLFTEVNKLHKCVGLQVNFSRSSEAHTLNWLFTCKGLIGMIETSNFYQIEDIILYIAPICDT